MAAGTMAAGLREQAADPGLVFDRLDLGTGERLPWSGRRRQAQPRQRLADRRGLAARATGCQGNRMNIRPAGAAR